jgi:hypothetical protein
MTKMATVQIHGDAKVSESRRAVTLWEAFTVTYKDGNTFERKRKWTIWFASEVSFNDGDWIEVKGELGTKPGSYEKDGETIHTVEHSINEPKLLQVKAKTQAQTSAVDLDDLAKYGNAPF